MLFQSDPRPSEISFRFSFDSASEYEYLSTFLPFSSRSGFRFSGGLQVRLPTDVEYRTLSHLQCREPRHLDGCLTCTYEDRILLAGLLVREGREEGGEVEVGRDSADLD